MDLQLLPEELKEMSLSKNEIVLEYKDIFRALDSLLLSKKGVLGYEVWFKYPTGISQSLDVSGKMIVDSSLGIERNKDEEWEEYVKRSNIKCKELIADSYKRLKEQSEIKNVKIYFCLTTCNENS